MLNRKKDAVSLAVAALLASAGFAYGAAPSLSLDPQTLTLDDATTSAPAAAPAADAAPAPLLTQGLTAIGVQPTLDKYNISIGGYFDSGYIYNHRNHTHFDNTPKIGGGGFNSESHNNYTIDAIDLNFTKAVDASKGNWDVGGTVEVMYGSDAAAIHSDGLEYGMSGSDGDRFHPQDQYDMPQAYLDIVTPIKGLKIRAGKFDTLLGYETINPNGTPFYSHSYIFDAEPLTHTGIVAFYQINDQLAVAGGITRGWDQALKDNNGAPDGIFQVTYAINKQWNVSLQGTVGPEDDNDTAHWRIAPDFITTYQLNDHWSFALEAIYFYDGGYNNVVNNESSVYNPNLDSEIASFGQGIGTYGDIYGASAYVAYKVDDRFTINFRGEAVHNYTTPSGVSGNSAQNVYEATLGVTITPMPKDKYLSGIKIRPEIRYDFDDHVDAFPAGRTSAYQDQLTFGADLIINF